MIGTYFIFFFYFLQYLIQLLAVTNCRERRYNLRRFCHLNYTSLSTKKDSDMRERPQTRQMEPCANHSSPLSGEPLAQAGEASWGADPLLAFRGPGGEGHSVQQEQLAGCVPAVLSASSRVLPLCPWSPFVSVTPFPPFSTQFSPWESLPSRGLLRTLIIEPRNRRAGVENAENKILGGKKVLKTSGVMVHHDVRVLNATEWYTWKWFKW